MPRDSKAVIVELVAERVRLAEKWGHPDYPNGTMTSFHNSLERALRLYNEHAKHGLQTWQEVLDVEIRLAFSQPNPVLLRDQLLRAGAVIVAWMEAIDARLAEAAKHELDEENLLCACGYWPTGVELVEARTSLYQHYQAHGGYVG